MTGLLDDFFTRWRNTTYLAQHCVQQQGDVLLARLSQRHLNDLSHLDAIAVDEARLEAAIFSRRNGGDIALYLGSLELLALLPLRGGRNDGGHGGW